MLNFEKAKEAVENKYEGKPKKNKGFTLVEVLAVMAISAAVTMGFLMVLYKGAQFSSKTMKMTRNSEIALQQDRSMVKYTTEQKYEDVVNSAGGFYVDTTGTTTPQNTVASQFFNDKFNSFYQFEKPRGWVSIKYLDPQTLIESTDPAQDKGLKVVSSQINWFDENPDKTAYLPKEKTMTLQTIISKTAPENINNKLIAGYFNRGMLEYTLAQNFDNVQNGADGFYINTALTDPYNVAASQYFKDRLVIYPTLKSVVAQVSAISIDANLKQLKTTLTWTEDSRNESESLESVMRR